MDRFSLTGENDIDDSFKRALKASYTFYANGHMGIYTSNHSDMLSFTKSMESSYSAAYLSHEALNLLKLIFPSMISISVEFKNCFHVPSCVILDETPNEPGFNIRREEGRIAGIMFLDALKSKKVRYNLEGKIIDTLDVICHSMGFAYAIGMIEELRSKIAFGRFYIIAPENASSGLVNLSEWQDKGVWQYGSDELTYRNTQPWILDGIAPQTAAKGLYTFNRAFIPQDQDIPQDFMKSHQIKYYDWIFTRLSTDKGYVEPRK